MRIPVDKMLLDQAIAWGAMLSRGQSDQTARARRRIGAGEQVRTAEGGTVDIEPEVLLDCSGQATFLANHGVTGPKYLGACDRQVAFFSQVVGAIRDDAHTGNGSTKEHHRDRNILKRAGERERSYETEDIYSIPNGSRYHPERAPLWEPYALVEGTEEWMGPR